MPMFPMFVTASIIAGCASGVASSVVMRGGPAPQSHIASTAANQKADPAQKTQKEFEIAVIQALLSPMLNSDRSGLVGMGSSGKYWRSMMSDQIARQIALSGQLKLPQSALVRRPGIPNGASPQSRSGLIRNTGCQLQNCIDKNAWKTVVQSISGDGRSPKEPDGKVLRMGEN